MAIITNDNFFSRSPKPLDDKYSKFVAGQAVPYATVAEANSEIPVAYRHVGLTVIIVSGLSVREYWYKDGTSDADLVLKTSPVLLDGDYGDVIVGGGGTVMSIDPQAITLDKMQNVTNNVILGRGSGSGSPQQITLGPTLNIVGTTFGVVNNTSTQKVEVSENGTLTSTRSELNFIAGPGVSIDITDNSGSDRADITISKSSDILSLNDLGDVILSSISAGQVIKYNGTAWVNGPDSGGVLTDGDYGDIIISGGGTVMSVDGLAVTYSKIQNITGSRLLGRYSGTAGTAQEVLLGNGLLFNSTALEVDMTDFTTTNLAEGTNKYFTETRVRTTPLTGYSVGSNTAIVDTDTVTQAFNKIQGQLNAREGTITAGTTSQYYRGDKTWQTLNTTAVTEGSNLYFTDARARAAVSAVDSTTIDFAYSTGTGQVTGNVIDNTTTQKVEVYKGGIAQATRKRLNFIEGAGVTLTMGTATADQVDITIASTLTTIAWGSVTGTPTTLSGYGITDAQSFITAGTTAQYYRGDKSWQTLNTAAVAESTNLYYTDARARAAVSVTTTGVSGVATYNSSTGVVNVPDYGSRSIATISGNTTAAANTIYLCDTASGSFTLTINPATLGGSGKTQEVVVTKITNNSSTVTISPSSGTISGAATFVMDEYNSTVTIVSNGTNLYII